MHPLLGEEENLTPQCTLLIGERSLVHREGAFPWKHSLHSSSPVVPPRNEHVPNKFGQCVLFQPKQNCTAGKATHNCGICTVTWDSIFS